MSTKTINIIQKIQGSNDSTSAQMVTVRDGYSSTPTHYSECGLGGTGEKESKPNNVTYIRFGPDFLTIPAGAIINSAVLTWNVVGCDWMCPIDNVKISPCANFTSTLTGKNSPLVYNTSNSSVAIPKLAYTSGYLYNYKGRENGRKVVPVSLSWDITNTIKYLIQNRLNCVRVFVSPGKNRKYLGSSATLSLNYTAAPEYCNLSVVSTDCNVNTYFEDSLTVNASSPTNYATPYYRFTFTSGSNVFNTSWSQNSSYNFSETQVFGSSSTNNLNILCKSSYDSSGQLTVSSSTLTIYKNLAPSVINVTLTSQQNSIITKNSKIYAVGSATISATITDSSIKKDFNGNVPLKSYGYSLYSGGYYGSVNYIPSNTLNIEVGQFGGKQLRVYNFAHDGFKGSSGYTDIYGASSVYIYSKRLYSASGNIIGERIPANTQLTYEVIFKHDQGLNNQLKITRYKKTGISGSFVIDNTVSRTILNTDLSTDSYTFTLNDTLTTPNSSTDYYEYKWICEATDLVKNYTTSTNTYKVNRVPTNVTNFAISGVNYKNYIITTYALNGSPIYTYSESGEISSTIMCYRDSVNLMWGASSDYDGDSLVYKINKNGNLIASTATVGYTDNTSNTQSATNTYFIGVSDGYNTSNSSILSINVNSIPSVPSQVQLMEYNYNTLSYDNVIYDPQIINRIDNKVKLTWNGVSNNVTPLGAMRYKIEVWKSKDSDFELYNSYSVSVGQTSKEFELNIPYTSSTRVYFVLYAIDRFNELGDYYQSEIYYLEQELTVPQIKGTKNIGYIWDSNLWDTPSVVTTSHFKKPIFFATVRNPEQNSVLNLLCRIFPKYVNGVDIKNIIQSLTTFEKTPDGLLSYFSSVSQPYVIATLISSSSTVPENTNSSYIPFLEKEVAFKLTDSSYLQLGQEYYVILRIQKGSSSEYYYTSLDDNATIKYVTTYEGLLPSYITQNVTKIKRSDMESIQSYINHIFSCYDQTLPVFAELDEKIYASTDNNDLSRPLQGLFDEEVAEPQNYNLCPYPDSYNGYSSYWYDTDGAVSISNKKLVFEGEGWARSLYLPWDYAQTSQLWVSFDLDIEQDAITSDRKYINYQIEFFDANKNIIDSLTVGTPLLLVNDENNSSIHFSVLDTCELSTGLLQSDIKYIKFKVFTESVASEYFLGNFTINNICIYKGTNDEGYDPLPYLEYQDDYIGQNIDIPCGSFNSWLTRIGAILYEFITLKLKNLLLLAEVAEGDIDVNWLDLSALISLTGVTQYDEIELNDILVNLFKETGIWGYFTRF